MPVLAARILRIAVVLTAVYLVFMLAVYVFQNRLLYRPAKTGKEESLQRARGLSLVPLRSDRDELYGYLYDPLDDPRGTVVVFHGNAGSALDRFYYGAPVAKHNFRVVLAEYPGYGLRAGTPEESTLVADARLCVERVVEQFPGRLILWGESLGCAVVTALVRDMPATVSAAVLVTPWESLPEVAADAYPFLPARLLCRESYNNVENLADVTIPIVVVAAGRDEVVGAEAGRRVFESYRGRKHLIVLDNAGHNTWPVSPRASWWSEVFEFVVQE